MNPKDLRRLRLLFMRIALWLCLPAILLASPVWPDDDFFSFALWACGIMLLVIGVLGRIWCSLYIGGRKKIELTTDGPYALCRNPLYLFSFFLGIGATLAFQNLFLTIILTSTYAITHALTIPFEESRLAETFGEDYQRYQRETPCFLPRPNKLIAQLQKSEASCELRCSSNGLRRAVWDGLLYCLAIPLGELAARLHQIQALPIVW